MDTTPSPPEHDTPQNSEAVLREYRRTLSENCDWWSKLPKPATRPKFAKSMLSHRREHDA